MRREKVGGREEGVGDGGSQAQEWETPGSAQPVPLSRLKPVGPRSITDHVRHKVTKVTG